MHRKNNYLSSKALAQTGSLKRNWGLLRPITSYLHLQELGIMERRHHLVTATLQEKKITKLFTTKFVNIKCPQES